MLVEEAPKVATLAVPVSTPKPKRDIICFSDFDGTIFLQDTGHVLFDSFGCGAEQRHVLDEEIKNGDRSFREVSEDMWASLNVPFDDGFVVMREALEIDSGFKDFHKFCIQQNIPFNVISAGLKPVLREVLKQFLPEEEAQRIKIIANDAEITDDGSVWKPIWLHDTPLGHDKAASITDCRKEAQEECEEGHIPLIVFIGDGVSDLPAAREADVLFARKGLRLEEYCIENKIEHIPFESFLDIKREIERLQEEDEKRTGGVGKPVAFNPRANMWRRLSSARGPSILLPKTPRDERTFFESISTISPKIERRLSSLQPMAISIKTPA